MLICLRGGCVVFGLERRKGVGYLCSGGEAGGESGAAEGEGARGSCPSLFPAPACLCRLPLLYPTHLRCHHTRSTHISGYARARAHRSRSASRVQALGQRRAGRQAGGRGAAGCRRRLPLPPPPPPPSPRLPSPRLRLTQALPPPSSRPLPPPPLLPAPLSQIWVNPQLSLLISSSRKKDQTKGNRHKK